MPKDWGPLIRAARDELGWSQADVAERLESLIGPIDPSKVSRWETGEMRPTIEEGNALVLALRLSAEEFWRAIGINLTPAAASKLPRELLDLLLEMSDAQRRALIDFVRPLSRLGTEPVRKGPRRRRPPGGQQS